MTARQFISADRSIGVELENLAVEAMLELCRRSAPLETGGLLIGYYSDWGDRVVVTQIIGPPRDSQHFRFLFVRGISGLTRRLSRLWKTGAYYVGEWHFHPFGPSDPSETDRRQIRAFARDRQLRCPHPVMVVVGGDPGVDWDLTVAVVVEDDVAKLSPG